VTRRAWTVRLSDTAGADYDEILPWTARRLGVVQATAYGDLLATSLVRLERGPNIAGARQRDEIGTGLRTLHVGRRGRHIILFRVGSEIAAIIGVLRILHDAVDLARHMPPEE
jgi:toxin ParE1/3/4